MGYVEGKNILIERYSGEGRAAHYPDLARDVVRGNPDAVIAIGNGLVLDFRAATTTIPIVGTFIAPVEAGIVSSLARPGGNITGVSGSVAWDLIEKRVQLLQQVVPHVTRFWRDRWQAEWRESARMHRVTYVGPPLDPPINEAEYRRVFVALARYGANGILVNDEIEHITNRKLIAELAEESRLPAVYPLKVFVESGGLMSYGSKQSDHGRGVALICDQILKGAKPADIPILQPITFELAFNLKTAKAIDLKIPPELLAVAEEVIE